MQYHIYIYTPPCELSNYFPHLIEHAVLWDISSGKEYFKSLNYSAENYTYYTCFTINSVHEDELEKFCKRITSPIPTKVLQYESKVLRQELQNPWYFQTLISKIWKKMYGNKYQYSRSGRVQLDSIKGYHQKYYQREKFVILQNNLPARDFPLDIFWYTSSFSIQIQGEKIKVLVWKYEPTSLFRGELLQKLFDEYLSFLARYKEGEYFSNETLAGDFDEAIFLAVPIVEISFLCSIPKDFVDAFIEHELLTFKNEIYRDIDGPLILKYGNCISEPSKREMIGNLWNYYQLVQKFLEYPTSSAPQSAPNSP